MTFRNLPKLIQMGFAMVFIGACAQDNPSSFANVEKEPGTENLAAAPEPDTAPSTFQTGDLQTDEITGPDVRQVRTGDGAGNSATEENQPISTGESRKEEAEAKGHGSSESPRLLYNGILPTEAFEVGAGLKFGCVQAVEKASTTYLWISKLAQCPQKPAVLLRTEDIAFELIVTETEGKNAPETEKTQYFDVHFDQVPVGRVIRMHRNQYFVMEIAHLCQGGDATVETSRDFSAICEVSSSEADGFVNQLKLLAEGEHLSKQVAVEAENKTTLKIFENMDAAVENARKILEESVAQFSQTRANLVSLLEDRRRLKQELSALRIEHESVVQEMEAAQTQQTETNAKSKIHESTLASLEKQVDRMGVRLNDLREEQAKTATSIETQKETLKTTQNEEAVARKELVEYVKTVEDATVDEETSQRTLAALSERLNKKVQKAESLSAQIRLAEEKNRSLIATAQMLKADVEKLRTIISASADDQKKQLGDEEEASPVNPDEAVEPESQNVVEVDID